MLNSNGSLINYDYLQLFKKNPLNRAGTGKYSSEDEVKGEPNTALLSTILVLGTFFIAFYMRKLRTSHFFGKRVCTTFCSLTFILAIFSMMLLFGNGCLPVSVQLKSH